LRSSGRGFDSRSGCYQATQVYSAFHPSGVGKSSTGLVGWGYGGGAFTCVGWRVTLCDPVWQVTLRSSVMGFPLRAIHSFNLFLTFTVVTIMSFRVRQLVTPAGTPQMALTAFLSAHHTRIVITMDAVSSCAYHDRITRMSRHLLYGKYRGVFKGRPAVATQRGQKMFAKMETRQTEIRSQNALECTKSRTKFQKIFGGNNTLDSIHWRLYPRPSGKGREG